MRPVEGLDRPRRRLLLAVVVSLLCAPALFSGYVLDDHVIGTRVVDAAGMPRWQGLFDAFAFAEAGRTPLLRAYGTWPWWSDDAFKIHFLRPLAALTHLLDFWLFRQDPWLMHAESLLLLLGLNLAVGSCYARLLRGAPRALGIACLLYFASPGHGFAASWLANRNACLAALFGVLSLSAHDRARSERSAGIQALSCLFLLLSLLSGEIGVSSLALLAAHALCLDLRSPRSRLLGLVPALAICTIWLVTYKWLGLGTANSAFYVDPSDDLGAFLRASATNLPILCFGQWLLPIASFTALLSRAATWAFVAVACASLSLLAPFVVRALRCDPRARFGAVASLLALIPVSGTVPHDRLLIMADVGACICAALTYESAARGTMLLGRLVIVPLATRLIVSVLLLPAYAASLWQYPRLTHDAFVRDLSGPMLARQSVFFVNPPASFFPAQLAPMRRLMGGPMPRYVHSLAPGVYPLEVLRVSERTLSIRARSGFLQEPGTWRAVWSEQPGPLSPVYLAQWLNHGSRRRQAFVPGQRVALRELDVVIDAVTTRGAVREASFHFARPLEDASYLFVVWRDGEYRSIAPPALGDLLSLPPALH
jgi:hypothetical protein